MESPLLSIVVPTKDRYYYLFHLIQLIESFNSTDVELVIQDNSCDNSVYLDTIGKGNHPLIKYNHTAGQLPMSLNSDLAVLNSSGDYICFIGDDDGVTKHVIDCAQWMKQNHVEAVLPEIINYSWPDALGRKGVDSSGRISLRHFSGSINYVSAYDELEKLVLNGLVNRGKMPRVYHGIVKRETLFRIKELTGSFFPASSPDISNAVALSLIVNKFAIIDYPITISGASKFHGGGMGLVKKKYPDLSDIPWLLPEAISNWEARIPKIGVGISIWADSAIKALRSMKREDLIEVINFDSIYSRFIVAYPDLFKMVMPLCNNRPKVFICAVGGLLCRYINAVFRLISLKVKNRFKRNHSLRFNTINEAINYLQTLYCKSLFDLD